MKTNLLPSAVLAVSSILGFFANGPISFAEEFYKDAWYYREQFEEAKDRAALAQANLDKAAERKAIDEQIENLRLYLDQSPSDLEMLDCYAMLLSANLRSTASLELACTSLEKLVEQDPDRTDAVKKLVELLIMPPVHRYNDAAQHLEALLQKTPDDSEALVLLGRCQIAMSRSEKAIESLQKAIECSAEEVDAYYFLAIALRFRMNRPAEADTWMDRMLAANPNSVNAHRYACNYLLSLKTDALNPQAAELHAQKALELSPADSGLLSLAAQAGMANGHFDSARQYAEKALELEKDAPAFRERMFLVLADVESRAKNFAKALEILQKAFEETSNPQLLWLQGDVQCDLGDTKAAAAIIEKLEKFDKLSESKVNAGALDYLRGRIFLLKSKWLDASKALENALPAFAERPDVLKRLHCWLGVCYGQMGNAEGQTAAFRRALAIDPKFEPAQKALDQSLKIARAKEDALPQNRQSSKDSLAILAKVYLAQNDWNKAREVLRKLANDFPEDPRYSANFTRELLGHGEIDEAEKILQKLAEKWPHAAQTAVLQAELLMRRGKTEDAVELLKSFIDDAQGTPSDHDERMRIAALAMEDFAGRVVQGDEIVFKERLIREAEMYLRQFADAHPSATLELAGFLARQKRFEDAADYIEKNWKGCEPNALATVCLQIAQEGHGPKEIVERMLAILHQGRKDFGDPPSYALVLGCIHAGEGKYPQAEEFFRQALAKNPTHTVAMNNLAMLLVMMQKDLPEALDWTEKAIKIAGPLPQMLDTRACVYIAQGDAQKALADLETALADARTAERLFHQAQAYELAGQKDLAAKAMKEAITKGLSEKTLSPREIPIFERLKKLADELSTQNKEEEKPSHGGSVAML
jgi:tetratricopeptide (TPR) repeat protein